MLTGVNQNHPKQVYPLIRGHTGVVAFPAATISIHQKLLLLMMSLLRAYHKQVENTKLTVMISQNNVLGNKNQFESSQAYTGIQNMMSWGMQL